eukprot:Pgem_evm1s8328
MFTNQLTLVSLATIAASLSSTALSHPTLPECPSSLSGSFYDSNDKDSKHIRIDGTSLTITSTDPEQNWIIHSSINQNDCSVNVDFAVPNKPNPPPVILKALIKQNSNTHKYYLEFYDPAGKLADASTKLNMWSEKNSEEAVESENVFPITYLGREPLVETYHKDYRREIEVKKEKEDSAERDESEDVFPIKYLGREHW